MSDKTVEITTENFETDVLKSDQPILLDFWAEWCGPCKMVSPIVEQLADEYAGKMRVGKVDADQHQDLVIRYQVMGLPTLILFKNGEPVMRLSGYKPKNEITKKIEATLNS
ncbi:MAG: thioredoxin [Anaerolineae bacterium]|nr:thioredoxin [Anaerolineae bacterium]